MVLSASRDKSPSSNAAQHGVGDLRPEHDGLVPPITEISPEVEMRPTFEQRFLVELRVVRVIWERLLAFVPTLNDGNIYFDSKIVSLGMMILAICHV